MIDVLPIRALSDNYIWCLMKTANRCCVIVDPGEAEPVLEMLSTHQLKLTGILITHHHWDHTQGIAKIVDNFKVPVYGPAREAVYGVTDHLHDGNQITLDDLDLTLQVTHIPGHTLGHIAYHGHGLLFSGDTLFTGGCGRIFEGTVEQMYTSLTTLAALKETTLVYCGHEYTTANLKFAQLVEPNNLDIQQRISEVSKLRKQDLPTVPAPLSIEKLTNPFLRCTEQDVIKAAQAHSGRKLVTPQEVLEVIRGWKNNL
jgi:hydroxyacylglutathione hydrolase